MKKSAGILILGLAYFQTSFADTDLGKRLYESRCAIDFYESIDNL